mmetsp:Transcript_16837/g.31312  ORF Transcript_16837/g.31312 Transcript_16837/m.31312 type:complete len:209 (-) Transcript_16837:87-713(-)
MSIMSEKSLTPFRVLPLPTMTRPLGAPSGHCKTQHGSRPSMINNEPSWTCTAHGSSSPSAPSIGRSATIDPPRREQPKSAHQNGKALRRLADLFLTRLSRAPPVLELLMWLFIAAAAKRAMTTPGRPVRPSLLRRACKDAMESSGKRTICSKAAVASSRSGRERCQCITAESTSSSFSTTSSSLRSRPIMRCNGHEPNCSVLTHAAKF